MKLKQLKGIIKEGKLVGSGETEISSITYDSRKVEEGALFVAIKGFQLDGHDFINQACNQGAVALIVEQEGDYPLPYIQVSDSREALALAGGAFYGWPSKKLNMIGITGTNGKTTTSFLVEGILKEIEKDPALIGTVTYRFQKEEFPGERTTPESLDLHEYLASLIPRGGTDVVMEVSSHALKLKRVEGIEFDVGVFTNLSPEHGEFHSTIEDYFQSKKLLFEKHLKKEGWAIVNIDDALAQKILQGTKGKTLTFSLQGKGDINGKILAQKREGLLLEVEWQKRKARINLNLTGVFNAYNCLAATGVGLCLGLELEEIARALEKIEKIPGRFEVVGEGEDFGVIVDFAHSPDSLANILQTAKKLEHKKLILVFGCGGDRDRKKRPEMGKIAYEYADHTIITSDNPRSEPREQIIQDICEGLPDNENSEVIADREKAIKRAIKMAEKEDIIVIAGKGHETGQEINGKKYPFDDREVAREAILARKKGDLDGKNPRRKGGGNC